MTSILDLASQDFTLVKESSNVWSTKEHDSLKFFANSNSWFWFSERIGGNAKKYVEFFWNLSEVPEEFNGTFTESPKLYDLYDEPYIRIGKKIYHKYFESRGINEETVKEFQLEYDKSSESVILPITNQGGRRIGNIKRKINPKDKKDRYKFVLWDNIRPPLWQMHRLKDVDLSSKILIFEGAWSAMIWYQVLKNKNCKTFAILGAFPSKTLKELLTELNIIYVCDNDETGIKAAKEFSNIVKCKILKLPKMPDEVTELEIKIIYTKFISSM